MQVKRFVNNPFQEISYLLFDETKEAILIDCGCSNTNEQERIIDFMEKRNLKLVKLLNTHLHIDHIAGNAFIKDHFDINPEAHKGDLPLYKQAPQQAQALGFPLTDTPPTIDQFIEEGDTITFGNQTLEALHIPGHSPGSLCYYSREQAIVIAGDVIFEHSVGRTDLWGGSTNLLLQGIKQKLLCLPDETIIAPGHGNTTTVGEEKMHNPFLT